jgi:BirA family biotin operon repressor/biotin-[acetyl-CoA-carboxylase] ligase
MTGSGPRMRTVGETGSTNEDLIALARAGAPEGYWLRAERQNRGRGRHGRVWDSPQGNLHASTLVRLVPGDPSAPTLALTAAVALHETAALFAPEADLMLKWPNDVLAGGAKLAGILLEREGEAVVVGFGVNLAHAPAGLDRRATSLAALSSAAPAPAAFLHALVPAFARWLGCWRSEGLPPVRHRWLAAAHPPGTPLAAATADGTRIEGLFDGLEDSGALRLRLAGGGTEIVHAGDVFLI